MGLLTIVLLPKWLEEISYRRNKWSVEAGDIDTSKGRFSTIANRDVYNEDMRYLMC